MVYVSSDVAERIKAVAKSKNIPLKSLLDKVGLGVNTMINMKTSMPKSDNLAKIADYLDVSVDYLLGRSDSPTPARDNLLKMAAETDDPEELLALLDIVNKKLQERRVKK